jgi:hypothetical protein
MKRIHPWKRALARNAPRRPEVDIHDAAAQAREGDEAAVGGRQVERRRAVADARRARGRNPDEYGEEEPAESVDLDNFATRDIADAVKRVRDQAPRTFVEVSGGVTLDRIRELAKSGVDIISAGAFTHSARAVDLSLEARPVIGGRTGLADRER